MRLIIADAQSGNEREPLHLKIPDFRDAPRWTPNGSSFFMNASLPHSEHGSTKGGSLHPPELFSRSAPDLFSKINTRWSVREKGHRPAFVVNGS